MTIGGTIIEALGLGTSRDAKLLVARLPRAGMAVTTLDDAIARLLERGGHRLVPAEAGGAEIALSLSFPEGDEAEPAFERLQRLVRATQPGGQVIVASGDDRARDAGLLLRAGLISLRQDVEGGSVFTSGCVAPE